MGFFLPEEFKTYISENCNRADFIQEWLQERGVHSDRIIIDGKNHILVQFGPSFYNPQFKIKTVIAHHDRVAGSPGANDNSAADFMLMNWAVELSKYQTFHNVRIFFTDGEELGWHKGVIEQGAYGIANTFKRLGITNDDVYVFDSCGRGEVAILSKTHLPQNVNKTFEKKYMDLHNRTQDLLRISCPGRWMCLPVPYSDNASFLACGIPAVAITMLPASEASLYARELFNDKNLSDAVMNRENSKQQRIAEGLPEYSYKERMPLTWRLFHTSGDNLASLTPESFTAMHNILTCLGNLKTLS